MLNYSLTQPPPYDQKLLNSFYCLIVHSCLFVFSVYIFIFMILGIEPRDRMSSTVFYCGISPPVLFVVFNLETRSHYIAQASPEPMLQPRKALDVPFSFLSLPGKSYQRVMPPGPPTVLFQTQLLTLLMLNASVKATEPPGFSSTALSSIRRALNADFTCNQETFKVQDNLL